jgi:hypothetical protein
MSAAMMGRIVALTFAQTAKTVAVPKTPALQPAQRPAVRSISTNAFRIDIRSFLSPEEGPSTPNRKQTGKLLLGKKAVDERLGKQWEKVCLIIC